MVDLGQFGRFGSGWVGSWSGWVSLGQFGSVRGRVG